MAAIISSTINGYKYFNNELSDPKTRDFFLIDSPVTVAALIVLYNYFVLKWGPEWMKDRKPYKIEKLMQIYNAFQVIVCSWIVVESVLECYGPFGAYSWSCEPVDHTVHPFSLKVARYFWAYFMLKVIDLLDTVFFVLRKKNSQISFLHVYHHAGMVIVAWAATKFLPGGQSAFIGMINCFVHAVMYSYYFITSYYPGSRANVWWKKYVTQLQMFQFLAIIIQFGQVLFQPSCGYPKWAVCAFLPHNILILALFWNFYKRAYLTPKSTSNGVHIKSSSNSPKDVTVIDKDSIQKYDNIKISSMIKSTENKKEL